MSEPTGAYSISDLVKAVAEEAGIADYDNEGVPIVPVTSPMDLNTCVNIVNRAIKMFISDAPRTGWNWQHRTMSIVLKTDAVSGDDGRYELSGYFGNQAGPINYAKDSNNGATIEWTSPAHIVDLRDNSNDTGYPRWAAIRASGRRTYELLVYPYPASTDTIQFPYDIAFDKMELEAGTTDSGSATTLVDSHLTKYADDYFNDWTLTIVNGTGKGETATVTDFAQSTGTLTFSALSGGSTPDSTSEYKLEPTTNYHPAGPMFDDAILAACLCRTEITVEQTMNQGHSEYYHSKALRSAYQLNARLGARKLGNLNRSKQGNYLHQYRKDVTYG